MSRDDMGSGLCGWENMGSQGVNWRLNEPPAWDNKCLCVGYGFKQDFSNVVGWGEERQYND